MELVRKITLSFTCLTPSSSFGILRGKGHCFLFRLRKSLGRYLEASGISRQLPKSQKASKDNGINVPLSPRVFITDAHFLPIPASADASARSTDRLIHYTASPRPLPTGTVPWPSQQGGRCRSSVAYCMHSRKKQSTHSLAVHPTGKRIH